MKLVVQVPCYDEAESLPATLAEIPRSIPGFDRVEVLVVDDGSRDGTAEVARRHGADHVVRFARNRGLARAFSAGLEAALAAGADVIVQTDADGQYPGDAIPALVQPLLEGRADLVIGDRRASELPHFSWTKRRLQRLGSRVVRLVTGLEVADAASGLRAMTRETAARLGVVSDFSYTIETILLAGALRLAVLSVPVAARETTRPSRLFRSTAGYVARSGLTLLRALAWYRPLGLFGIPAVLLFGAAAALGLRFLYYYATLPQSGHVQSVVLAGACGAAGFVLGVAALLADGLRVNRMLALEALYRLRRG